MSSPRDWQALRKPRRHPAQDDRPWDLRRIEQLDHIGAQLLWNHWGKAWPAQLEMDSQHKAVLEQVAQYTCRAPPRTGPTLAERFKRLAHNAVRADARRRATSCS